jgi:hypothetical protein
MIAGKDLGAAIVRVGGLEGNLSGREAPWKIGPGDVILLHVVALGSRRLKSLSLNRHASSLYRSPRTLSNREWRARRAHTRLISMTGSKHSNRLLS